MSKKTTVSESTVSAVSIAGFDVIAIATKMVDDPAFATAIAERRAAIVAERRAALLAELDKLGGLPAPAPKPRKTVERIDTNVDPEIVEKAAVALAEAGAEGIAARTIGASIGKILVSQGRATVQGTAGATRYFVAANAPLQAAE